MSILTYILLTTIFISLVSLTGMLTLILKERYLEKLLLILVALSAGSLMGGAFLHLIPKAVNLNGLSTGIFLYILLGFCFFFILEQFVRWHSCPGPCPVEEGRVKSFSYLILLSDGLHNFIDGLIIAASFTVSLSTGAVTVSAIALHEVAQEVGDFGVLVYGGFHKAKALILNFAASTSVILGGICGYFLTEQVGGSIVFLIPFAAGSFTYIAASDLIPEIKHKESLSKSLVHFLVFTAGIGLMLLIKAMKHIH